LPECLEDWADENNPVRVIGGFIEVLELGKRGFFGVELKAMGRPTFHPCILLKLIARSIDTQKWVATEILTRPPGNASAVSDGFNVDDHFGGLEVDSAGGALFTSNCLADADGGHRAIPRDLSRSPV